MNKIMELALNERLNNNEVDTQEVCNASNGMIVLLNILREEKGLESALLEDIENTVFEYMDAMRDAAYTVGFIDGHGLALDMKGGNCI